MEINYAANASSKDLYEDFMRELGKPSTLVKVYTLNNLNDYDVVSRLGPDIHEHIAAKDETIRAQSKRIAELEAALEIAKEYLDDRVDVNWEGNAGNDAMKCLQEINEAMEKR
jgi:BMFP domain-containing protein YqiC